MTYDELYQTTEERRAIQLITRTLEALGCTAVENLYTDIYVHMYIYARMARVSSVFEM